ncbi:MAG: hypothetical protein RI935_386 [Candidatus Parcubacteria bacterium]|jgi:pimeloyl-ACP methyl ester carboxylesterase
MKLSTKIKAWAHDYLYMLYGVMAGIVYITPHRPHSYASHLSKNPVVILPGVFNKWGFMKKMVNELHRLGHPVYVVPKLGYNLHTIPHSANLVTEVIEENNLKNVILIGHSKGGLIGKYILCHNTTKGKVIGMISIATPYSGSEMTKVLPIAPLKELHTTSQIIKDLQLHVDVNKKIISIIPEYDNHVWSEEGSYLEGAKNIHVPVHGHHKIVFDREVIASVVSSITEIGSLYSISTK